mgnify:CR=1 FL=1
MTRLKFFLNKVWNEVFQAVLLLGFTSGKLRKYAMVTHIPPTLYSNYRGKRTWLPLTAPQPNRDCSFMATPISPLILTLPLMTAIIGLISPLRKASSVANLVVMVQSAGLSALLT